MQNVRTKEESALDPLKNAMKEYNIMQSEALSFTPWKYNKDAVI